MFDLNELCRHILGHFFDGLNYSLSIGQPENKGLLMKNEDKKKHQRAGSKAN